MNIKEISSPQNPIIKELALLLTKSKARRSQGRFLIEGLREVQRACLSGYHLESLIYRPELVSSEQVLNLVNASNPQTASIQHIHCSAAAFSKLAYRSEVPNLVAVARCRQTTHPTDELTHIVKQTNQPLILILDGIEKPGNLGAILRSADAFAVDAVILVDCDVELEHPNSIRNSLGAALALPVFHFSLSDCAQTLQDLQIPIYITHLHTDACPPDQLPLHQASALILGSEAHGAQPDWFKYQVQATLIPMNKHKVIDSLNVSVATSIMLYEAQRQRQQS